MVYDRTILENLVQKKTIIEKIIFKFVQIKFFAMHINNQKLSFNIFTVGNLQYIFMEHDFTNIHQQFKIGFVLQGHISKICTVRASTVVHVGQNTHEKNITDIRVRMRLVFSEDHRVITEVV